MRRFSGFMERKDRENKNNLRVLSKVLERAGFTVHDHLDHHQDPYIYIEKPIGFDPLIESLTFGGIRVYTRGTDIVSFRPQNKEAAEPFGLAYLLDVTGMYKDLIREQNTDKIGLDLIRYLVEEVSNFFVISAKKQSDDEGDKVIDSMGTVINGSTGGAGSKDYGNSISNRG
jgi:hypothetical protein